MGRTIEGQHGGSVCAGGSWYGGYSGVGGHLFAIAANKSVEYNYNGAITGNAANAELLEHYCKTFHADFLGMLHPYQMMIDEENAAKIMKVYDYEWTDDEL